MPPTMLIRRIHPLLVSRRSWQIGLLPGATDQHTISGGGGILTDLLDHAQRSQ
jgi:hypothetical protein